MTDVAEIAGRLSEAQSVEMPERVVHMETRDGRLFVTLEGGRVVDMTDWFAQPTGEQPCH